MPGLSLVEKRAAAMIANQEFILSTLTAEEQVLLAPKPATPTKSLSSPKKRTTPSNGTPGSTPGSRQSKRIKNYADQKREDEADYVESETEGSPRRKPVESPPPSIKRWKVNSKVSGHQTGIEVGRCFATRLDAHYAGIHAPPVGGISGNTTVGCWSVALSGGYPDDIDLGDSFTYTGSGGTDLSGTTDKPLNRRTAPQTFDQEFTLYNLAHKVSVEKGKPVRVLRGYKGKSEFAPLEGYRYDGLYTVTRAWMAKGESGFKVTRFQFERLPGQAAIPTQTATQRLLADAKAIRDAEDRARELGE